MEDKNIVATDVRNGREIDNVEMAQTIERIESILKAQVDSIVENKPCEEPYKAEVTALMEMISRCDTPSRFFGMCETVARIASAPEEQWRVVMAEDFSGKELNGLIAAFNFARDTLVTEKIMSKVEKDTDNTDNTDTGAE